MAAAGTAFVPDVTGKTVIVTGSNRGIDFATAKTLAGRGARVVLAVRYSAEGEQAAKAIRGVTEVRKLDRASLDSVRSFASAWNGSTDILINNAGISAPKLGRTADGFELQFGTNHLGPFALTNLLLSNVVGRVVTVGSRAEQMGRINFDDLNWKRTRYSQFRSYANSKLANLLFTAEFHRRLSASGSRATATVAHPGLVSSHIYDESTGFATSLQIM